MRKILFFGAGYGTWFDAAHHKLLVPILVLWQSHANDELAESERDTGLEPVIFCLENRHSTTELIPQKNHIPLYQTYRLGSSGELLIWDSWKLTFALGITNSIYQKPFYHLNKIDVVKFENNTNG